MSSNSCSNLHVQKKKKALEPFQRIEDPSRLRIKRRCCSFRWAWHGGLLAFNLRLCEGSRLFSVTILWLVRDFERTTVDE